jgi:uncharacterized protein (DUF58 family)
MVPESVGWREFDGPSVSNRPGTSGDVLGVRLYRRGDPLRRIHWGQSARHDRLILCEAQSQSLPHIQIVLDTDPAVHSGTGSSGSLEWSIRVAASFVERWLSRGALIAAVIDGKSVASGGGKAQLYRLMDALSRISTAPRPCPSPSTPLPWLRRSFDDGLRLVITTDRALRLTAELHANLLGDRRQRFVVLAAGSFAGIPRPFDHEALPMKSRAIGGAWLWLDDPARVPAQLRGLREVLSAG